jgi:hypothetical protein
MGTAIREQIVDVFCRPFLYPIGREIYGAIWIDPYRPEYNASRARLMRPDVGADERTRAAVVVVEVQQQFSARDRSTHITCRGGTCVRLFNDPKSTLRSYRSEIFERAVGGSVHDYNNLPLIRREVLI